MGCTYRHRPVQLLLGVRWSAHSAERIHKCFIPHINIGGGGGGTMPRGAAQKKKDVGLPS